MKKEQLFDKLRKATTQQFDMPATPVKGIVYNNVVKKLLKYLKLWVERSLKLSQMKI